MAPSVALAALSACSLLRWPAAAPTCAAVADCDADEAGLMQLRLSEPRSDSSLTARGDYTVLPNTWFTSYDATGSWATVQDAVATCQQDAGCAGFFTKGSPPADQTASIYVWFSTAPTTAQATGYTAYQIQSSAGPSGQRIGPTSGAAYKELPGMFFASYDANTGSWETVASAQDKCSLDSSCKGFFFQGTPSASGEIYVWFSTSTSTAAAAGYTAYAKDANGPTPTPAPTPPPSPPGAQGTVSSQAWELFLLTNEARAEGFTCPANEGYQAKTFPPNPTPLVFDCRLAEGAEGHASSMATLNYFSHDGPDGSPSSRGDGENLYAGSSEASAAVKALLQSAGHCRIMGDPSYTRIGTGYAYGGSSTYKNYWEIDFSWDTDAPDTSCYPTVAAVTPTAESRPDVGSPALKPTAGVVHPSGGWTAERMANGLFK